MHLAVVNAYSDVAGIRSGKRSLLHAIHQTLHYGRNKTRVDSASNDTVAHHKLAAPFEGYFLGVAYLHHIFLIAELV